MLGAQSYCSDEQVFEEAEELKHKRATTSGFLQSHVVLANKWNSMVKDVDKDNGNIDKEKAASSVLKDSESMLLSPKSLSAIVSNGLYELTVGKIRRGKEDRRNQFGVKDTGSI